VSVQHKANGAKRIIMSPGPKVRCAQHHVGRVLGCWGINSPFEHNGKGLGQARAIKEIVRLIEDNGVRSFVHFDISNFFSSVKPNHMKGRFHLPRTVINNTVFFNRSVILFHHSMDVAETKAARQCLPTGARLSGFIASMLLGQELRKLSGAMGIVTFVDDGLIGACDPAGAKTLAQTLNQRLQKLYGGPLSFKYLNIVNVEEGFSFLGFWIRLITVDGAEKVLVKPSHESHVKLKRNLFRQLKALGQSATYDEQLARADEYLANWLRAKRPWIPTDLEIMDHQHRILEYVTDFRDGFANKHQLPKLPKKLGLLGLSNY